MNDFPGPIPGVVVDMETEIGADHCLLQLHGTVWILPGGLMLTHVPGSDGALLLTNGLLNKTLANHPPVIIKAIHKHTPH